MLGAAQSLRSFTLTVTLFVALCVALYCGQDLHALLSSEASKRQKAIDGCAQVLDESILNITTQVNDIRDSVTEAVRCGHIVAVNSLRQRTDQAIGIPSCNA